MVPMAFIPPRLSLTPLYKRRIHAQDLGRLLTFDLAWLRRAATDAYGQVLNLHGAIQGTNLRGELLSYEVPTYFGMLCAAYQG